MKTVNNRKLAVALVFAAALTLSACTNNTGSNQSDQAPIQENSQNINQQQEQNEDTVSNEQLANTFQELIAKGGVLPEIFSFLDQNIESLSKEQVSEMLLTLEDTQIQELGSLAERYYEGDTQVQINDIFDPGETLDELINQMNDSNVKALLIETRDSGYLLDSTEGMFSPELDYRKTATYADKADDDVSAYLKLKVKESEARSFSDGAMIIGWDELLDRALAAEAFTQLHPDSKRIQEAEALLTNYSHILLHGVPNTPLFSYDLNEMDPNAQKAYHAALENTDAADSTLLENLKKFMDAAAEDNYKLTDSLKMLRDELVETTT